MDDTHQLNASWDLPVQHQVTAYGKITEALGDIRPGLPQFWIPGKQPAFLLDGVEQTIGSGWIVLGNIKPEGDQVRFSLGGLAKNRHVGLLVGSVQAFSGSLLDFLHGTVSALAAL